MVVGVGTEEKGGEGGGAETCKEDTYGEKKMAVVCILTRLNTTAFIFLKWLVGGGV